MQTPSKGPTLAQLEMLRAIWELTMEHGWPPSYREILEWLGYTGKQGVADKLNILQREGWIVRENMQARCIKLTRAGFEVAGIKPDNPYLPSEQT